MDLKLENKIAIITGSTEGIGLATALALSKEGAQVIINGREQEKIESALNLISQNSKNPPLSVIGDITLTKTRSELINHAKNLGKLDILVNNAGGGTKNIKIHDVDDIDLEKSIKFNLSSAFSLARDAAELMKQQSYGRIINVSSVAGRHKGRLSGPQYSAAKAGMIGFTRHFSWDLGRYGITVNSVAPGFVMTQRAYEKWNKRTENEKNLMLEGVPVKRFATPEEIAYGIVFLASERAAYITGICLDINGGSFMN